MEKKAMKVSVAEYFPVFPRMLARDYRSREFYRK